MSLIVWLIGVSLFLIPVSASAIDLDAPVEKKVTVRSEIERGKAAIDGAVSGIGVTKTLAYREAITAVFDFEKQKNTDTDSFLLGASFEAWLKLDHLLQVASKNPDPLFFPKKDLENVERWAEIYFTDFRKAQKKLGLSDEKLAEASGLNVSMIKGGLYRWDKKTGR